MKTQYLRMLLHARDPTYLSDTIKQSYRSTNTQNLKEIKKEMFNLFNARTSHFMPMMDAMKHQGTCRHSGDKLSPAERKTAAIVGEGSGLAPRSVHRYIRLADLIPELLEMVDDIV